MKKIRILLFITLLLVASNYSLVLARKRNSATEQFLTKYRNADVLVFGSSHAFVNLNGKEMWENYGIAIDCLAQPEQNMILTYYNIKEALKYDTPDLIVLESYMATITDENYQLDESHYSDAILSFPFFSSLDNRIEMLKIINKGDNFNYFEYLFGFPIFHSDYYNGKNERNDAGFVAFSEDPFRYDKYQTYGTNDVEESLAPSEGVLNYYIKIIDLCKEEEIPLLIITTPYLASEDEAKITKYLENVANKNDIEFIDMNNFIDEIGFVLEEDMYDGGHSTISGTIKNSKWLGKYIHEKYGIISEKDNDSYTNWNSLDVSQ